MPTVIPWVHLATADIPGDAGSLRLMQRGAEFSIMMGTNELMNSRRSGSETALARIGCARVRERPGARILIGGLGMGFTLRAAIADLRPDARVVVAELVPAVIEWARGPMAHIFEGSLSDPRVGLYEGDVVALIASRPAAYDAILLDVDNGPDGLVRRANNRLYDMRGLSAARAALKPQGVLGVWSSAPSHKFSARLKASGFDVEEVRARAHDTGGARDVVWIGTRREARRWGRQ